MIEKIPIDQIVTIRPKMSKQQIEREWALFFFDKPGTFEDKNQVTFEEYRQKYFNRTGIEL